MISYKVYNFNLIMQIKYTYKLIENLWYDKYWSSVNRLFKYDLIDIENWEETHWSFSTNAWHIWYNLSANPNISWNTICKNHNLSWNYEGISKNPNITLDIIKKNIKKFKDYGRYLSQNPNINWDFIQQNKNIEWHYDVLSSNPSIKWDIIKNNVGLGWSWSWIVKNPSIHWKDIDHNPDKGPFLDFLSKSEKGLQYMTWSEFHNYLQELGSRIWYKPIPEVWHIISRHKSVTWEIINKFSNYPWNPKGVSENSNISWDIILKIVLIRGTGLIQNTTITPEIIENNMSHNWNWSMLSHNKSIDLIFMKNIKTRIGINLFTKYDSG